MDVEVKKAFEKAVDLLSRREHSEKEIRQKLKLREFEKNIIDEAVKRLIEYKYLCDERYARMIFNSLKSRGFGIQKIRLKFRQKGLLWTDEINALVEESSVDDEKYMQEWLNKKSRFIKEGESRQKIYEKLLAFLIRKGFSYDKAQSQVKLFLKELRNE